MLALRVIPGTYGILAYCPSLSSRFQLQNRPLSLRCYGIFLTELTQSVSLFFFAEITVFTGVETPKLSAF